jgi:hypothetical protein
VWYLGIIPLKFKFDWRHFYENGCNSKSISGDDDTKENIEERKEDRKEGRS